MGIFNDYTREGKGIDKKPDNRPRFIIFFDIYFRKFWSLALLNIIYILFCIPIITIGPATAAMTKILRNYAREEHAFVWSDFWDTFRQNFRQGLVVGLVNIFAVLLLLLDFNLYMSMDAPQLLTSVALAVILLSITVLLFMNYYLFVMMVTFRLTLKQLFKNAFIFAWAGFFRNLLITIFNGIIIFICAVMILGSSPAAFLLVLFVLFQLFSTCGLISNFITYPLVKKYMIDGFDPETGERLDK